MRNSKLIFAITAVLMLFSLSAQAKLFKWVDKDGITHYGSTIPPEYAGQKTEQLNNGMVVQEQAKPAAAKKKAAKPPKELTPEEIEQKRRDNALLGTYDNPDEIDRAMERELQQVDARMESINIQIQTSQEELKGLNQQKSDLEKGHRKVGKLLQDRISQVSSQLDQLTASKNAAKAEKERIRAQYASDKKRYIELSTAKPDGQNSQ